MGRSNKWFNILSIVISAAALVVSIRSFVSSNNTQKKQQELQEAQHLLQERQTNFIEESAKSYLGIRIDEVPEQKVILLKDETSKRIFFRNKFRCVLSNHGQMPTTIIDAYFTTEILNPLNNKITEGLRIEFTPLLLDNENNKLSYPLAITIPAREAKVLYIDAGIIIPNDAWEAIKDSIILNHTYDKQELDHIFMKAGYATFGYSIEKSPGMFGYREIPQNHYVRFTKEDGTDIKVVFGLQRAKNYLQGENISNS